MKIRVGNPIWSSLTEHLLLRGDVETMAILLAREIDGEGNLAVVSWMPLPDDAYTIREFARIEVDPIAMNRLISLARRAGHSVLTIHTHPMSSAANFSAADDNGDARLLPSILGRLPNTTTGSMVLSATGNVAARTLRAAGDLEPTEVWAVGDTLRCLSGDGSIAASDSHYLRQVDAIGATGQVRIGAIRVGVVGLGGIGSMVAAALNRMGVRQLVFVDADRIEASNVPRIDGARVADVGLSKVEVAAREVQLRGFGTEVQPINRWASDPVAASALAACDVIYSCVDRHAPRAFLNRFAYANSIALFDLGTGVRAGDARVSGRISICAPGLPCLACRGHIDAEAMRNEALPGRERDELASNGYVHDADVPVPSVGVFNGVVANQGVAELLFRVAGFGPSRMPSEITLELARRRSAPTGLILAPGTCSICGSQDATNLEAQDEQTDE